MAMNRKFGAIAAATLTAALLLTACSSGSKPADSSTAKSEPATTATTATPAKAGTYDAAKVIPLAGKPVNKYDKFFEEKDGVKHFYLWIEEKEFEILKGVKVPVWSFNGTLPGPEIRVQQGDKVQVHFRNTGSQPHALHFHGNLGLSQAMDGVPATSAAVNPGKEFTYEFVAENPGTMMYHCHVSTYSHLDMGMYGAFIVEPKDEKKNWTKEYTLFFDDWATDIDPLAITTKRDYKYFTVGFSGGETKAFPEAGTIEGKVGDVIKVRYINIGYRAFSIHSHGYGTTITHLDGYPVPAPYQRDVITVNPGERVDFLFTVREGIYPFHDHQLENVLNNGEYLGGATFLVIGKK